MAKHAERPMHYSTYGTTEKYSQLNETDKRLLEEFLAYCVSKGLSSESIKQYDNKIRIFLVWLLENRNNKSFVELTAQDVIVWQSSMMVAEKSSSTIRQMRASLNSFSTYIECLYDREYPNYKNVIKKVPAPKLEYVREKTYLPNSDFIMLKKELEKREEWQKLVYLSLSYDSAGRKTEIHQALKEIDWGKNETKIVRGKGGKKFTLPFSNETATYIKKWLEVRGEDDCNKLFVLKTLDGTVKPIGKSTLSNWCQFFSKVYKELTGREEVIYAHCFKTNRLSNLYHEEHKPIEVIQRFGHHENSNTTMNSYIQRKDSATNAAIFDEENNKNEPK